MAGIITQAVQVYDKVMKNADPRVADWFMMDSPVPSLVICLAYFIFVALGPTIMEGRKPIAMRRILVFYNIVMVGMSTFCFVEFLLAGWLAGYSLRCQPVDYSDSPQALRMARVCWWFYFSKFIELLDTVFFIMRKKFSQVSFLHVFHHGIMPISWWFGVKLVPGGFGTFHSLLNSFIHLMMYTYYGLSAMGPAFSRFLWWKKYMTSLQITQFMLVTVHSAQLLFLDCNYPIFFVYWIGFYAVIFLVMFMHFYIKTYRAKGKTSAKTSGKPVANGKDKSS